jgi:hypothetical protein
MRPAPVRVQSHDHSLVAHNQSISGHRFRVDTLADDSRRSRMQDSRNRSSQASKGHRTKRKHQSGANALITATTTLAPEFASTRLNLVWSVTNVS